MQDPCFGGSINTVNQGSMEERQQVKARRSFGASPQRMREVGAVLQS